MRNRAKRLRDEEARKVREQDASWALSEDVARLAEEVVPVVDRARDSSWYEEGSDADYAAAHLCRLRRAAAADARRPQGGDEAVRRALSAAEPDSVVWLASRAVSFMDEHGFPEAVERAFPPE